MNIKGFISQTEMEIEQLQEDIFYATNDVTIRIIEDAIQHRKDAIKNVKEKYGS